jgi:hypothetical protein
MGAVAAAATAALILLSGATSGRLAGRSLDRTATAEPFDRLLGAWSGDGTLLGRPARFEMSWSAGAAPDVYRLSFSNGFVDSAAPSESAVQPVLSAEALYWQRPDGGVEGTWFDTRGVRINLEGTAAGNDLRITWAAPTENGVTLYRLVADGVEVVDSVQTADGWREFGRAHYRRD